MLAAVALTATACTSGGHRQPRRAGSTSTTVPATTTTTEVAPTYSPSPYTWQLASSVPGAGGGPGATLSAVLSPPLSGNWLIAGTRLDATNTPLATLWTSPDTTNWSAAPITPGEGPSQAESAARYQDSTVVVGSLGEGANEQAAVWLSGGAGEPFTAERVPLTGGPSNMTMVAVGALGFFAYGSIDGRPAVWSSTNGHDWGENPSAEKQITGSPGARVNALVAVADKVYAAGSVENGGQEAAAVWSTSDGLHWQPVQTAQTAFNGSDSRVIYGLSPLGTGLVAVGAVSSGSHWLPASWISPDGASWSQPSTEFTAPSAATSASGVIDGGVAVRSVSAVPTFAGATSVVAAGGGPDGQEAWESTDGIHWTPLALPGSTAGSSGWRATLVAGTTSATVVADGDPGQPHVLSDEASGWQEPSANPAVFGPVRPVARPLQLATTPSGLILAVEVSTAPQSIGTPATTVMYLTSRDGASWAALSPLAAAATGAVPATLPASRAETVHLPAGWLAAGGPATSPDSSWISPNGSAWTATGSISVPAGVDLAVSPSVDGMCPGTPSAATSVDVAAVGAQTVTPVPTVSSRTGPPGAVPSSAGWYHSPATGWHRATFPPASAAESVSGCAPGPGGLVAYGQAAGSTGQPQPGLWHSPNGVNWSRQDVPAFAAGSPAPLVDLATSATDWLAVANPNPSGGPVPVAAGSAPAREGAAAPAGSDTAVGPAATLEDGREGIWLSADGGGTWQLINTGIAPWLASQEAGVDLTAFAGTYPVVVGEQDGRLAIWFGSPVTADSPAPSSHSTVSG